MIAAGAFAALASESTHPVRAAVNADNAIEWGVCWRTGATLSDSTARVSIERIGQSVIAVSDIEQNLFGLWDGLLLRWSPDGRTWLTSGHSMRL